MPGENFGPESADPTLVSHALSSRCNHGSHRSRPAPHIALWMTVGAAVGFSGCGELPGVGGGAVQFEVTDSAGVELVRNGPHGPLGSDPVPAREVLRIGVVEGEDSYQFSRILDVEVAADGRILVANGQTATVRVFDPEGSFIREFGGRGEGPGEFIAVNRVVSTGEDITVIDFQTGGRSTRFSADGRVLSVWRHTGTDGVRTSPSFWTSEGWFGSVSSPSTVRQPLPPGTPDTTRHELYRLAEGTPDVPPEPDVVLPPAGILYATEARGGTGRDWGLVEVGREIGVDGDGRWIIAGGVPYAIEVYSPEGELARRITREYAPVPLNLETEVEEHLALAEAAYRPDDFPMGPEQARIQLEQYRERVAAQATFPVPDHRPPARELLVSPDGSFWVERVDHVAPARLAVERTLSFAVDMLEPISSLWDMFDESGRLLGQIELPPRFTPMRLGGRRVYGVLEDELGVEYVVALEAEVAG